MPPRAWVASERQAQITDAGLRAGDGRPAGSRQTVLELLADGTARAVAQLARLVPVHNVTDLTLDGKSVERELALVKVVGTGDVRVESLRIADIFRARVLDSTNESFVFEIVGDTSKLDAFIKLMQPLGLVDVSRTGVVAIARGTTPLNVA